MADSREERGVTALACAVLIPMGAAIYALTDWRFVAAVAMWNLLYAVYVAYRAATPPHKEPNDG